MKIEMSKHELTKLLGGTEFSYSNIVIFNNTHFMIENWSVEDIEYVNRFYEGWYGDAEVKYTLHLREVITPKSKEQLAAEDAVLAAKKSLEEAEKVLKTVKEK